MIPNITVPIIENTTCIPTFIYESMKAEKYGLIIIIITIGIMEVINTDWKAFKTKWVKILKKFSTQ